MVAEVLLPKFSLKSETYVCDPRKRKIGYKARAFKKLMNLVDGFSSRITKV